MSVEYVIFRWYRAETCEQNIPRSCCKYIHQRNFDSESKRLWLNQNSDEQWERMFVELEASGTSTAKIKVSRPGKARSNQIAAIEMIIPREQKRARCTYPRKMSLTSRSPAKIFTSEWTNANVLGSRMHSAGIYRVRPLSFFLCVCALLGNTFGALWLRNRRCGPQVLRMPVHMGARRQKVLKVFVSKRRELQDRKSTWT